MQDEWVVSRVFHKSTDVKKSPIPGLLRMNSIGDQHDLLDYSSLPPLMDPSYNNKPSSFNEDDFKGTNPISSSSTKSPSDGYYLPSFSINNHHHMIKPEDQRNYEMNTIPTINYTSNLSNPMGNNNNTFSHSQFQKNLLLPEYYVHQNRISGFGNNNNNHDDQAFLRAFASNNNNDYISVLEKQCKVEQFSSNHSQDTGLSNDRNTTETSSVVSGRNRASLYEDLDQGPASVAPALSDLECLWDY